LPKSAGFGLGLVGQLLPSPKLSHAMDPANVARLAKQERASECRSFESVKSIP
jgi:hypothetical protein